MTFSFQMLEADQFLWFDNWGFSYKLTDDLVKNHFYVSGYLVLTFSAAGVQVLILKFLFANSPTLSNRTFFGLPIIVTQGLKIIPSITFFLDLTAHEAL